MSDHEHSPEEPPIRIGSFVVHLQASPVSVAEYFGLSSREVEVLQYLAEGVTGPEIARQIGVSVNTINTYKERCTRKLGISRIQLAVYLVTAYRSGAQMERLED